MFARPTAFLARTGCAAFAALVAISLATTWAGEDKESREGVVVVLGGGEEAGYWIGIACEPASEKLRSQHQLAKDEGLVVEQVVPGSPAAKAGLKAGDIITKAGDTVVDQAEDLIKLIAAAKESEIKLRVIRDGEFKVIAVKPARREAGQVLRIGELQGEAQGKLKEALEQLQKSVQSQEKRERAGGEREQSEAKERKELERAKEQLQKAVRESAAQGNQREEAEKREREARAPGAAYRALPGQPSVAAWTISRAPLALPDDMQITISKQGKQPAKIAVKQGEKSWEATEDKLDKLPAEVRAHVGRMLGQPYGAWGAIQPSQRPAVVANPAPRAVQVVIGEDGKAQVTQGGVQVPLNLKEFRLEGKEPPKPGAPAVQALPGGGVRFEIREPAEGKTAANPQPLNARPAAGWVELNRGAAKPDAQMEHRLHEMQEQIDQLRKNVDELRKAGGEKSGKKSREKAKKAEKC